MKHVEKLKPYYDFEPTVDAESRLNAISKLLLEERKDEERNDYTVASKRSSQ